MPPPPVQGLVLGAAVGSAAAPPADAGPQAAADAAESGTAAEPERRRSGGEARGRLLGGRLGGVGVVSPRQLVPKHCGREAAVGGAALASPPPPSPSLPSQPPRSLAAPPPPRLTAERPPRARQAVAGGAAAGEDEEGAVEGVGAVGQRRVELEKEGAGLLTTAAAKGGGARQPGFAQPRRPTPDLAGEAGAAQPPGTGRPRGRRLREAQLHAGRHVVAGRAGLRLAPEAAAPRRFPPRACGSVSSQGKGGKGGRRSQERGGDNRHVEDASLIQFLNRTFVK